MNANNKGIKNLISGIINKKQIEANKKEFLTREKEILEDITILSREISKQYKRNILKFQSNKEKYQKRYDEILEFTKEAAFRIKNRYIENRDKDYKNLAEYEVRYKEIEKYMLENKYLIVEFIDELENLKEFISDKLFILIAESFFLENDIKPVLNELQKTVNIIGSQKEYTKLLSGMTEIEHNILNVSQILYNKEFGLDKLPDLYILNSKNKFEKTEEFKELKNLESSFKDEFDLIQKTLDAREKMVISHIKSFYNQKIVDLNGNKEYKKFKKQIQKKRNILGISDLFKLYNDRILDIYPCFLVNSTTASNIFPMNAEIFDYIIIDESSSLSLENYIPSLYRGRYLTLVGDKFNINSEIASDLLKDSLVSKSLIENTSNNQRLEYMHN